MAGLSDGLRAELARDQIVVTTVCPGLMRIGSPINAAFKGQRSREYSWFAIASSLPVITISAERAAHQILDACRYGDAELVITLQAKLAVLARTLAPECFSAVARTTFASAGRGSGGCCRRSRPVGRFGLGVFAGSNAHVRRRAEEQRTLEQRLS